MARARRSWVLVSALSLALLATCPARCSEEADGHWARLTQQHTAPSMSTGGRALLQAPGQHHQQEGHAGRHNHDITVEEAILQTYAPGSEKKARHQLAQEAEQAHRQASADAEQLRQQGVQGEAHEPVPRQQQQQQQQKAADLQKGQQQQDQRAPGTQQAPDPDAWQRRQQQGQEQRAPDARQPGNDAAAARARQLRQEQEQRDKDRQQQQRQQREQERRTRAAKDAQQAQHARLLERQRQEAAAAGQRRAAQLQQEKQQQSLGRGSLRSKAQAAKPPVVRGSNKLDIFAQHTERQLADVRARLAAQRAQQQQAPAGTKTAGGGAHQQAQPTLHSGGAAMGGGSSAGAAAAGGAAGAAHRRHQAIPLPIIVAMTLVMAAAAGLGALPFFFVRTMSDAATGVATAIACGVMLAASFDLVHDGQPYGAALTVLGVLLGAWFIRWVQQHLAAYEDIQFGSLQGSSARKTVLMVGIMAAHALGEGCAVGVSFCGERGWAQGVLTTLAIGVHNIPEGLAKATVLVGQGVSARRALLWSVATCLPQPLVAVPSFMFVEAFTMILPVALGFAAGCMVWMVFAELLPDALERADAAQVATAATVSAAGLEGFRMFFASMEQADGSFGGGAAAAHAAGLLSRMGPPLLVLLPAVVAAAASGGALGGSALPPPVAWGVAAAVALSSGGGALLDQLLWRAQVPSVHTLAAGAVGATLAVLLHRQLLHWADASAASLAACKLHNMHKAQHDAAASNGPGHSPKHSPSNGHGRGGAPDVEALEYASLYQQHHLHHHPGKTHHPHTHPLPHPHMQRGAAEGGDGADGADGAPAAYMSSTGGSMNGFGGSSSSLHHQQAPYHRGGTHNGSTTALADGSSQLNSGVATPSGFGLAGATTPVPRGAWRSVSLLPAPQLAAAGTAGLALAAAAVTTGWHIACVLLLLATDRSTVLLPAALLLLAGPGLGAGALARTAPSRNSATAGAWAGGAAAALAALAAALTAARAHESAHTASLVKGMLYPNGITDTAEALTGGALCAAGWLCLAAGSALKPRSARGGLALGLAAAGLLGALRFALCSATPYCLSIHTLLQQSR